MVISSRVPLKFSHLSVLEYLTTRFTYWTKENWLQLILDQKVRRNDTICSPETTLEPGDIIGCEFPDHMEPEADLNYKIIYEDEWVLGINKPGNLLIHRGGAAFKTNLIYQIRHQNDPPFPEAGVINRLDRETSGVVLVGKNNTGIAAMNRCFAAKEVYKEYQALVHGSPSPAKGSIDLPIGKRMDSKIASRFGVENTLKPRHALTHYEVLQTFPDHALMKLIPATGRTHQLRIHMQALGHLIVGDKLYGLSDDDYMAWRDAPPAYSKKYGLPRQLLHCSKTRFHHPIFEKEITIEAELLEDFKEYCKKLTELAHESSASQP